MHEKVSGILTCVYTCIGSEGNGGVKRKGTVIADMSYTHPGKKNCRGKWVWEREQYQLYCSFRENGLATWKKHDNDRLLVR